MNIIGSLRLEEIIMDLKKTFAGNQGFILFQLNYKFTYSELQIILYTHRQPSPDSGWHRQRVSTLLQDSHQVDHAS